jgi:TonB dependent receptor/CarboxypepD_reg-like domain/TonB-dependent Receptor Plug Domain
MKQLNLFIWLCLITSLSFAQNVTISGYIKDEKSKEALIGATLYAPQTKSGTTTNEYGFYSFSMKTGDSTDILISFIGYQPQAKRLFLKENTPLDIFLTQGTELKEVTISASRNDYNVSKAQVGIINVPMREIKNLPVLAGERDVLKVLQFLPGVQQAQEGTTGFLVRGGNVDQNLVQLDEATVYNPNHLFGLFSTFNVNALNNVQLIKGGFPSKYGGRLSSILDITMKDGNKEKFEMQGGIGLLSTNLSIEGPIIKDKASFIVSGRRSYLDLLLAPFTPADMQGTTYRFYDLNAKINFDIGKRDKLFLSAFQGNDYAAYTGANSLNYGIDFGNSSATLRWNHLFGGKVFANTSAIINNYNLGLGTTQGNYYALLYTGIDDVNLKTDFTYIPNTKHNVKVGVSYYYHVLYPASFSAKVPRRGNRVTISKDSIEQKYSNELAFYAGDEWDITPSFSINYGVRMPFFSASGKTYQYLEPRLIAKLTLDPTTSLKASYTQMNQFLHLVPNSTASLPTDIWLPSSPFVKPQGSSQYSLGIFKNFKDNALETSVEIYYKDMRNQVLFKEATQLTLVQNIEDVLTFGSGTSYGLELFVKKSVGKMTGWVCYTLSKTDQTFAALNLGQSFPFTYDRRHNFSIAATYDINDRWTLSADFVYHSGNAFTMPTGLIPIAEDGSLYDGTYYHFTTRNNARLNAYHRLDVSASYKKKRKFFGKTYESEWVFGAYNLYSRLNPYFVYLTIDPNTKERKAVQVSLLPIIPSIAYNFKF